MAKSKIEWTDETWNPVTGCDKISPGCKYCYAERMAKRLQTMGQPNYANGFEVTLQPHMLQSPLTWKKPRMVFVNSMSDLFHDKVPTEYIQHVFGVMQEASQHTFQILTKRANRLAKLAQSLPWPLNVWMGVSVEDQAAADKRIPYLSQVPAAVRFLSCEPLLGPVDLYPWMNFISETDDIGLTHEGYEPDFEWVIVGGESGPNARPMHPNWARSIRDQCQAADVPFFFKQWGEWYPFGKHYIIADVVVSPDGRKATDWSHRDLFLDDGRTIRCRPEEHTFSPDSPTFQQMYRIGKHHAGRMLDGQEWSVYPKVERA